MLGRPLPPSRTHTSQSLVTSDWEFYKNALRGHYDALALQSAQIQQAAAYARGNLPIGVYVAPSPPLPIAPWHASLV
jgi:hypothetical protein